MYTPTGKKVGGAWAHIRPHTQRIAAIALVAFLVPMMAMPAAASNTSCGSGAGGLGVVKSGHLSGPGESRYYTVSLAAGETFRARLLDTGGIGMGLYGPDATTCGASSSGAITYTADEDGTYRLHVHAYSSGGDYTVIGATTPGIKQPLVQLIEDLEIDLEL